MKRLPRTQFGNPILRKVAKKVSLSSIRSNSFESLINQMFFTMHQVGGVGLAAPQIGESLQLAVIEVKPNPLRKNLVPTEKVVIINPKIIAHSDKISKDWEGCLSFKGVRGLVPRYENITVEYLNENGEKKREELSGFQARVFQHEIDHLNGKLYIDKMEDMTTLITLPEFKKRILKQK